MLFVINLGIAFRLSLRVPELKFCLEKEQSKTYLTLILMSYNQEPSYLDQLLSWLTDVDKFLEGQYPSAT